MEREYDYEQWRKVNEITDPIELMNELKSFQLKGRVIKNIYYLGYLYTEKQNFIEIDEPFMIEFEDGDHLDIEYDDFGHVRIAMNTLIVHKKHKANHIFPGCIGGQIRYNSVKIVNEEIDNTNRPLPDNQLYIDTLSFWIAKTNHDRFELFARNDYDYGMVWVEGYPWGKGKNQP
ncbi:MAG: hypothetical protein J6Y77_07700 [Paludibacteraceae bacterium]|nr:hypothetical protein [Paludibacteraceae bacterium]